MHSHDHSHDHSHEHSHDADKQNITFFFIGCAVFAAAFAASLFKLRLVPELIFIAAYLILGLPVILEAIKALFSGRFLDENSLMTIATAGALAIGEFPEAVAVMLFYQIGERFQNMAVGRSRRSISALMDIRPDYANLLENGTARSVSPETLEPGAMILVKPGERVPLDGELVSGEGYLDTMSLTGESLPRYVRPGNTVLSGCISKNGALTLRVTKHYGESTASRVIELAENAASRKSPTESFIRSFSKYYTPAVVLLATALAILPPLLTGSEWNVWLQRALVFLVVSCPCALVVSVPLGFFGGIGAASRHGILVKGGNYLEALKRIDIAAFDKTGTLTKGVLTVSKITPANGYSEQEILKLAAHAEAYSSHPAARAVREAYSGVIDESTLSDCAEIAGKGVSARLGGLALLAGSDTLMSDNGIACSDTQSAGLHLAVNGQYAGHIGVSDETRPDGAATIAELKRLGLRKTVMLSGDKPEIAALVARELGIDEAYGGLLPHEKLEKLEKLQKNGSLAYVGDGINDAPSLARADIGIAMGALGSDAAIEAADVVLMNDEPSALVRAVKIARATSRVVWQNIALALGAKALVLILGAFGLAGMWEAVFADVGVCLIAVLNSTRMIRYKVR